MTDYQVVHRTRYTYDSAVSLSYGQSCLLPRDFEAQTCLSSLLTISPKPSDERERVDFYGNRVSYFNVTEPHEALEITATSRVSVAADRSAVPDAGGVTIHDAKPDYQGNLEAIHYLLDSKRAAADERVRAFAAECLDPSDPIIDGLGALCSKIYESFGFDATTTTVTSTVDDLFEHGAGVCQDFAHLAVAALRAHGIPARYVSGYLETVPPPGVAKLVGADVSHAWASAMLPDGHWIDLDPTNDQFVDDRYVTTGWGRDYADVPPLKGVIYSDSRKTKLTVSVDVTRID